MSPTVLAAMWSLGLILSLLAALRSWARRNTDAMVGWICCALAALSLVSIYVEKLLT